MRARTAVVGVVIFLAGCASVPASAPAYSRAPDAGDGRANVYVYRGRLDDGRDPCSRVHARTLFVDGRPAFDLVQGAYTVLSLAVGTHRLELLRDAASGCAELEFYLHVEDSRSRYVRISDVRTMVTLYDGPHAAIETRAENLPESAAEAELKACCRYVAADPLPSNPSPSDALIRGHR